MVKFIKRFYLVFILLFLYAPIAILIIFSFNANKSMANWGGFSLKWYVELFADSTIMSALSVTMSVALLSSLIATVLGTLAAIGIHSMNRYSRSVILNISYLPIINPDIVTGISLMMLFVFIKIPRGYFSLLLSHITFNLPYVIYSVLPKLKQMKPQLYEAALDLGATPGTAIRKIIVPEIMPGAITGALLAFTLSLDDFVISMFATQNSVQNLSMTIYSMARRGISPKINALSALMFVAVVTLLLVVNRRASKDESLAIKDEKKISKRILQKES